MFPEPTSRSAILDAAGSVVAGLLAREGVALAEPVRMRFRSSRRGSTGVEVSVKVADPAKARTARAVLTRRFAGPAGVDVIDVS